LADRIDGFTLWEKGDYEFRFSPAYESCVFLWKGERLYMTACEALYLYERLILGKARCACTSPQAAGTIRERLGNDFLQEYLPVRTQAWHEGRRSDLEREADGSYYINWLKKEHK
jgi:hypothetical protein